MTLSDVDLFVALGDAAKDPAFAERHMASLTKAERPFGEEGTFAVEDRFLLDEPHVEYRDGRSDLAWCERLSDGRLLRYHYSASAHRVSSGVLANTWVKVRVGDEATVDNTIAVAKGVGGAGT